MRKGQKGKTMMLSGKSDTWVLKNNNSVDFLEMYEGFKKRINGIIF